MISNKAFEKLTFYLSAKDAPENVWEYARQIEKDLEVLDILKKIVKIVDYSKQPTTTLDDQLVILSGGELKSVEDYDRIKEWLENGNNNR